MKNTIYNFVIYRYRKLLRDYTIRSVSNEPWMKKLRECQHEIAKLNPHPNYLKIYRDQEIYFWVHIPKWIMKDWANRKVKKCLDIGCAYGTLALYCKKLFNCEVYCTDYVDTYISPSLVKKYKFMFSINNIELDPFPWNDKFDVIIFTEVLEHLNFNPIPTLKKIRDLLSDNGKLYLSTPDASQWGKITKYYSCVNDMPPPRKGLPIIDDHIYQYCKSELLQILDVAGFKVKRFSYSPGKVARHFNLTLVKK